MLVIGAAEVWAGGWAFAIGVWIVGGLMIWELTRMMAPDTRALRIGMGILAAAALALSWVGPGIVVLPVLVGAAALGASQMPRDRALYLIYGSAILLGCHAMEMLREFAGLLWILWVICVVILSDVAGYFAGKTFGGPKFWPSISPKKTWSGTIAGWIGAALAGAVFGVLTGAGAVLIVVSVIVGLAGQMGDIAESALKRRMQIKDSSSLIPGHGGVLDRFDAMLAAALAAALMWGLGVLPGLT